MQSPFTEAVGMQQLSKSRKRKRVECTAVDLNTFLHSELGLLGLDLLAFAVICLIVGYVIGNWIGTKNSKP